MDVVLEEEPIPQVDQNAVPVEPGPSLLLQHMDIRPLRRLASAIKSGPYANKLSDEDLKMVHLTKVKSEAELFDASELLCKVIQQIMQKDLNYGIVLTFFMITLTCP